MPPAVAVTVVDPAATVVIWPADVIVATLGDPVDHDRLLIAIGAPF
jgi:hypothetical protein